MLVFYPDFSRHRGVIYRVKGLRQPGVNVGKVIDFKKAGDLIGWAKISQFTPPGQKSNMVAVVENVTGGMGHEHNSAALVGQLTQGVHH